MDTAEPLGIITRLVAATNAHDVDRIALCFAPDYRNETPAHPDRGFTGREQVRRNWTGMLAAVPDLHAEAVATVTRSNEVWVEWVMSGTRGNGDEHRMVGVIVFTVGDDLITGARFYLEPVEHASGSADEGVRRVTGVAG